MFLIGGLNKKIGRFRFKAAHYSFFLYMVVYFNYGCFYFSPFICLNPLPHLAKPCRTIPRHTAPRHVIFLNPYYFCCTLALPDLALPYHTSHNQGPNLVYSICFLSSGSDIFLFLNAAFTNAILFIFASLKFTPSRSSWSESTFARVVTDFNNDLWAFLI